MNSLLASNRQVNRYIAFHATRYNAAKCTTFIPLFVPYKMSLTLDGDSLWTVHRCFVIEYQKPNHSGDAHLMLPDVSGNVSVVWAHHVISANDARLFVNSPRNLHSTPTEASMLFTGPRNFWTIYDGSSCVMVQSARCKLLSQDKASLTMLGSDLGV